MEPVADVEQHRGGDQAGDSFDYLAIRAGGRGREHTLENEGTDHAGQDAHGRPAPDPPLLIAVAGLGEEGDERRYDEQRLQALAEQDDGRVSHAITGWLLHHRLQIAPHAHEHGMGLGGARRILCQQGRGLGHVVLGRTVYLGAAGLDLPLDVEPFVLEIARGGQRSQRVPAFGT